MLAFFGGSSAVAHLNAKINHKVEPQLVQELGSSSRVCGDQVSLDRLLYVFFSPDGKWILQGDEPMGVQTWHQDIKNDFLMGAVGAHILIETQLSVA